MQLAVRWLCAKSEICNLDCGPDMGSNTWKCISIQIHLSFKNTNTFPTKVFKYKYFEKYFKYKYIFHLHCFTNSYQVMLKRKIMYNKHNLYLTKCCWAIIALDLEISFNFLRYSKMSEHNRLGFSRHDCEMKSLNIRYCLPVAAESSMSAVSMCIFIAKIMICSMEQFYSSKDRCNSHQKL